MQQSAVRTESRIERYSWMTLAASALLGVISALITTMPPISWFWNPVYESAYSIMGAWGVTWVGFNVLALIVTLIPYRRHERWAWFTLWILPLGWVSQFVLLPDVSYLMFAFLTTIGLGIALPKVLLSCGERRTGQKSKSSELSPRGGR